MRKVLAMGLTLAMLAATLSGCGSAAAPAEEKKTEAAAPAQEAGSAQQRPAAKPGLNFNVPRQPKQTVQEQDIRIPDFLKKK